mmetsp:Transcript_14600/g.36694  ORF Transcript_14600/g.36694 Transcript_14600/m.36694 type:complete len:228 (+) Transcript_14600:744-1427(+)
MWECWMMNGKWIHGYPFFSLINVILATQRRRHFGLDGGHFVGLLGKGVSEVDFLKGVFLFQLDDFSQFFSSHTRKLLPLFFARPRGLENNFLLFDHREEARVHACQSFVLFGDIGKGLAKADTFVIDDGQLSLKLFDDLVLESHLVLQIGNLELVLVLFDFHHADLIIQNGNAFGGARTQAVHARQVIEGAIVAFLFFFRLVEGKRLELASDNLVSDRAKVYAVVGR